VASVLIFLSLFVVSRNAAEATRRYHVEVGHARAALTALWAVLLLVAGYWAGYVRLNEWWLTNAAVLGAVAAITATAAQRGQGWRRMEARVATNITLPPRGAAATGPGQSWLSAQARAATRALSGVGLRGLGGLRGRCPQWLKDSLSLNLDLQAIGVVGSVLAQFVVITWNAAASWGSYGYLPDKGLPLSYDAATGCAAIPILVTATAI